MAEQSKGTPLPRPDPDRFRYLSPDKQAEMPPGFRLPTPEELAKQTLDNWVTMQGTHDGN